MSVQSHSCRALQFVFVWIVSLKKGRETLMTFHSSFLIKDSSELIYIQPAEMNEEGGLWINRCSVLCGILSLIILGKWTRNINLSDKQFPTIGKKCWSQPLNLLLFTWAEESQELQCYLDYFETAYLKKIGGVTSHLQPFEITKYHNRAFKQKRKKKSWSSLTTSKNILYFTQMWQR